MKDYDAVLHFSHSESFGMVCYEALYYGLPVISADCGGPAEMMVPGVSGILLPVGDVAGFAAAMERLINDEGYRGGLSKEAAAFVRHKFGNGPGQLSAIFAAILS